MKTLLAVYVLAGALWPWNAGHAVLLEAQEIPYVPTTGNTCEDWTAWIPSRTEPAILMQAVTEGYLPVQENFIVLMEANSGFTRENIYLMCLDKASEKEIAMMGFRCVPVYHHVAHDLSYVWKLRIKVLACLLSAGHSIILSDSDALWLKDPFQDFDLPEVRGSSIVASRGSFPKDLWKPWGSTLCMGFIFFRAGMGTEVVTKNMERFVMQTGDDQMALNYAVDELGIVWDKNSDMRYVPSTDFGKGTIGDVDGRSLNVTLLPHSTYTRKCNKVPIGPKTTVAHCHTSKHGRSKVNWMKQANLWVMDDVVEIDHGDVQGVTLDSRRSSTSGED